MEHAIDLAEANFKTIYSVNILSAMLAIKSMENTGIEVIRKCWKNSHILEAPQVPAIAKAVDLHAEKNKSRHVLRSYSLPNRISVKELRKPLDEDFCIQDFELQRGVGVSTPNEAPTDIEGEEEEVVEMPIFNEQLRAVRSLRRSAQVFDIVYDKFSSSPRRLHAAIHR